MGSVRGIQNHNERLKESHTNPDIDSQRSYLNQDLHPVHTDKTYYNRINDRIKELDLPKAVRKDAVTMCGFVCTSDQQFFKQMPQEEQNRFFKESYEFLKNRYGEQNIVAAKVHYDETTPHLHCYIVPVTSDGRLCAKDIFTRTELKQLQTDYHKCVTNKGFNLDRGEQREEKRRHLSTEEYKLETKRDSLKHKNLMVTNDVNKLNDKINEVNERAKEIHTFEKSIIEKEDTLKQRLNDLSLRFEGLDKLDTFEIHKELLGGKYKLIGTYKQMRTILECAKRGIEYDNLQRQYNYLADKYEEQKELVPSISDRMHIMKDKERLEQLEKAFSKLPDEVKEQLLESRIQEQVREFDRER